MMKKEEKFLQKNLKKEKLIEMSKNAKKLSNKFKWPIIAKEFNNLYIKVLDNY